MSDTTPALTTVDPCRDAAWADLVAAGNGSVFVSPPWLRAIEATYDLKLQARVRNGVGGEPAIGMAYCELDDVMGRRIVSTPYCDFSDPVAVEGAPSGAPLLDELLRFDGPVRLRVLESPFPLDDERLTELGSDFWHGVGLQRDLDEIQKSLGSTANRNIRKARNNGVAVRFGSGEADVDAFFALHQKTRRAKHGMLAQPRRFFHEIAAAFAPTDGLHVALAELDGVPIAGIFLLEWNGRAYYKFNASDPEALAVRPNDLLMWESMRWASERGNDLLDLGLSDADQPGLIRYKRKFATAESTVTTYTAGPRRTAQATELGPVFGELTKLLCDERVPLDVAERAGNILYRYFT